MKRNLSIIIRIAVAVCMLAALFSFTGCGETETDRNSDLIEQMKTFYSELDQKFPDKEAVYSFSEVEQYLSDWGELEGLDVRSVKDHYMIISNHASKSHEDDDFNVIQCTVDTENIRGDLHELSLCMAALLGPVQHGRIKLIVTESQGNRFPGAADLKKKSIKGDHFIQLKETKKNLVYTKGPLEATCKLTRDEDTVSPEYTNAFLITFSISQHYADPYLYDKKHSFPNPAETLGDLLASAKSAGRLFEVASFQTESEDGYLPHTAKALVVIDDNNIEAFQKRFEKSYQNVEDKFDSLEDESFVYTMEEAELPETVLNQTVSDNLISLMYTLQTGPHVQSEDSGTVYAASYIESVSTEDGKFKLRMNMRSLDEASMDEMTGNYLIAAGLSDANCKVSESKRLWTCAEDSDAAAYFVPLITDETEDTDTMIRSSECDIIWSKRHKTDIISCWYDKSKREDMLTYLLNYMDTENTEKAGEGQEE